MSHFHEQQDDSAEMGDAEISERCASCDGRYFPSDSDAIKTSSYCSAECEADEGEDA